MIIQNLPQTINSPQTQQNTVNPDAFASPEIPELGLYATYSSIRTTIDLQDVRDYEQIRYGLLKTQRDSLKRYASKKHRISQCHHSFVPDSNPTIDYNPETTRSSFHNVMKCENQYCAICSVSDGYQSRQRLARIMNEAYKRELVPVMVTLTIQHDARWSCAQNVDALKTAWSKFTGHRKYKEQIRDAFGIFGYAWSIDETFSPVNGSHVHMHIIFLIEPDKFDAKDWANDEDDDSLWTLIANHWEAQVHKVGRDCVKEYAVDIQHGDKYIAEYIAKHGKAPKSEKWDITAEATLKAFKRGDHSPEEQHYTVFELLLLAHFDDLWATRLYAEYVDAMKGKKRMNLSSSVVALENDIVDDDTPAVDDELDNDDTISIPSFEATRPAWRYARTTVNKRGHWLKLHQENRLNELAYDVAECHVKGSFIDLCKLTDTNPVDGWHKIESGSYHIDRIDEVGRVFVVDGNIREVVLSQPLDSGFYGRWIVEQPNDSKGLLRSLGTTDAVADKSKQLSLPLKGGV